MIRLSPSFVWLNADSMPHDPFLNDLLLRSSRSNGESVDNNSIVNYNLFQVRDKNNYRLHRRHHSYMESTNILLIGSLIQLSCAWFAGGWLLFSLGIQQSFLFVLSAKRENYGAHPHSPQIALQKQSVVLENNLVTVVVWLSFPC